MAKYEPEFEKHITARLLASGTSQTNVDKLLDECRSGKVKVRSHKDRLAVQILPTIFSAASEMAKMRWAFLDVAPDDTDFVIGDHPVCLTSGVPGAPLGLNNSTTELIMPLSRRMVACGRHNAPNIHATMKVGGSAVVNRITLRNVKRFLFSSFKSQPLLMELIQLHGTGPKTRVHRVRNGEALLTIGVFSESEAVDEVEHPGVNAQPAKSWPPSAT